MSVQEIIEYGKKVMREETYKNFFGSIRAGEIIMHLYNDILNKGGGLSIYDLAINKLKVSQRSYPVVLKTVKSLEKQCYLIIEKTKKGERRVDICKLTDKGLIYSVTLSTIYDMLGDKSFQQELKNIRNKESFIEFNNFLYEYMKERFEVLKKNGIISNAQVALYSSFMLSLMMFMIPFLVFKFEE